MTTAEFVVLLIRSFIKGENKISFSQDEIKIEEIYNACRNHKIENITLAAVKKANFPIDDKVLHQWEDLCDENTIQLMLQESEKERLVDAFNEAKIAFLPLKGWHLRDIYPKQEYRFMSDLDILIHREDREAVCLLLKGMGYSGGVSDYGKDDSYTLEPCVHVEIHLDLVSVELEDWFEYYRNIWNKAISVSDYEYKLSWDDYYIFMMVNFLKDYTLKGAGIRSIIDFYYFLSIHRKDLDFNYTNREFKKLKIYDLAQETEELVELWFGNTPVITGSDMGTKLLQGSIYGTDLEYMQYRYNKLSSKIKGKSVKKIVYLLRRAFPEMKIMKYKYPILNKMPFLLPVCWCIRLIRHFDRAKLEINNMKKVKD